MAISDPNSSGNRIAKFILILVVICIAGWSVHGKMNGLNDEGTASSRNCQNDRTGTCR
jgi:hypothetical protein